MKEILSKYFLTMKEVLSILLLPARELPALARVERPARGASGKREAVNMTTPKKPKGIQGHDECPAAQGIIWR